MINCCRNYYQIENYLSVLLAFIFDRENPIMLLSPLNYS